MKVFQFTRKIRALLTEADTLCSQLRQVLTSYVDPSVGFETELVCREALTNSIEHGCRLDPSRTVVVDLFLSDGLLTGQIQDDGEGLYSGSEEVAQGAAPKAGGNGLWLIREYTDQFGFKENGRIFTFQKKVQERRQHG